MLSTNSSTSWFCSSRKYSLMVSPVSPMRARTPGDSFIWPNTSTVLESTPESCISCQRSLPSAGALAHASEHRHALVDGPDVADELLDDHGLADASAAVGPDLAAFHERRYQVEYLDAGFQNLDGGTLVVESGRVAVDGPFHGRPPPAPDCRGACR